MSNTYRLVLSLLILVVAAWLGWSGYLTTNPEAIITWSTETEVDTAGFHVYRATDEAGPYTQVTESLILSTASDQFSGGEYEFHDPNVETGVTYYYQLEELEKTGNLTRLPDTVPFEARTGILGLIDRVNWAVVSILLAAWLVIWMLPGSSSASKNSVEEAV